MTHGALVKNLPASAEDTEDVGSILGLRRSAGEGNGNPPQYSFLGNLMDRGDWKTTVQSHKELDMTEQTSTCDLLVEACGI